MEELDLKELFNIFWAKKVQIILIIIIFAVVGFIYTVGFVTPEYTASTTLVLATSNTGDKTTQTEFNQHELIVYKIPFDSYSISVGSTHTE